MCARSGGLSATAWRSLSKLLQAGGNGKHAETCMWSLTLTKKIWAQICCQVKQMGIVIHFLHQCIADLGQPVVKLIATEYVGREHPVDPVIWIAPTWKSWLVDNNNKKNLNDRFNVWNHRRSRFRPTGPTVTFLSTDEATLIKCLA